MAAFLSDEWFAKVAELTAAAGNLNVPPVLAGLALNVTATGLPQGNVDMCNRILRDGTGVIQVVYDSRDNLGSTKTQGLDLALRYGLPTPGFGRFNFAFDGTYLLRYDTTDVSGQTDKHAGNYDGQLALPLASTA